MAQAKTCAEDEQYWYKRQPQQALESGVLDEVQIHQIPVLLGRTRMFDVLAPVELDVVQVIDTCRLLSLAARRAATRTADIAVSNGVQTFGTLLRSDPPGRQDH